MRDRATGANAGSDPVTIKDTKATKISANLAIFFVDFVIFVV